MVSVLLKVVLEGFNLSLYFECVYSFFVVTGRKVDDDLIVQEYENIDAENTGSVTLEMLSKYAKDIAAKCTAERCEQVVLVFLVLSLRFFD